VQVVFIITILLLLLFVVVIVVVVVVCCCRRRYVTIVLSCLRRWGLGTSEESTGEDAGKSTDGQGSPRRARL